MGVPFAEFVFDRVLFFVCDILYMKKKNYHSPNFKTTTKIISTVFTIILYLFRGDHVAFCINIKLRLMNPIGAYYIWPKNNKNTISWEKKLFIAETV
jgi:hypothetical protein